MSPGTTERDASPGRILRALNVPEDLRVEDVVAWAPPSLRVREAPEPLSMQLGSSRSETDRIEPGETRTCESESGPEPKAEPPVPEPKQKAPITPDQTLEQIAVQRPEELACAVRTLLTQPEEEGAGPSAISKVAILVVGLGSDLASGLFEHCTQHEMKRIARAVCELEPFTARQRDEVFSEIRELLVSGSYLLHGGVDFVRDLLQKTLGSRDSAAMLHRLVGPDENVFSSLGSLAPEQIVPFISNEHPQTIALVLSQMSPARAAGVLSGLPEELQADVAHRIASMESISPRVLQRLEEDLAESLKAILVGQLEIGGPGAAAEILNKTSRSAEKTILEKLDQMDPGLAEEVRNRMFTFEDITKLTDGEIQTILREVEPKDLAIALKGSTEDLKGRIFASLDEETASGLKEKIGSTASVRMSDVKDVQLRILSTVRRLEEAGQITIVRGDTGHVSG